MSRDRKMPAMAIDLGRQETNNRMLRAFLRFAPRGAIFATHVAPTSYALASGDTHAWDRGNRIRIEAGQLGEMAAASHVIAIGSEAGGARRKQDDPGIAEQLMCPVYRRFQIPGGF